MTTYAVIGTGAVGGCYGIQLARSGAPVHFLIRHPLPPDAELTLRSPQGTWSLRSGVDCSVHRELDSMPRVDVVLVAVKAPVNAQVIPALAPLVKPGGGVLLVQNGIDAEPEYAAGLPSTAGLAGGLAFIASYRESPSSFVHVDYGALTVGAYAEGYAPVAAPQWLRGVADDLERAEVPVTVTEDLLSARWQKLVWNIPFNGLSVLLDARTDQLMASAAARRLITALMSEVVAAAAADGRPLQPGLPEQMMALTEHMRPYAPSMKLDRDAGRPMEIDALHWGAVRRAERAGVALPMTAMLAGALDFLEGR